jgi:hypothetical protein
MTLDAKNRSDYKSAAYVAQEDAWKITHDLWQSSLYVRKKETAYLEKFKKEHPDKYTERLNRSVFTSDFRNTIETMAGMVFKDDPSPGAKEADDDSTEVPKAIADLFTDIDGCGNSLHEFLVHAFEMYLRDGNAHIFVDSPKAPKSEDGKPLTQADRANDRPIWILYTASQVISQRYETISGKEVLSQAVIEEKIIEPDGLYGEKEVLRHRILRRGSYAVEIQNEKKEWVADPNNPGGPTGLTEIPLVSIAEYGAVPMLLTLAMLNQLYYNKISDFDSWCHIACVPRQVIKLPDIAAADKYKDLAQTADTGLKIIGESADAFYLEPSGAGLEIAATRNAEIKSQMDAIGVGLLAPTQVGTKSATEVLDTAGQRQSKLARYARTFENAIEKAFYFTGEQWNVIRPGLVNMSDAEKQSLKLKMDFDRLTFSPEQLAVFERLVANGDLSHLTLFEVLQNVVDFPPEWTPEVEAARLAKEKAAMEPEEPVMTSAQKLNAARERGMVIG